MRAINWAAGDEAMADTVGTGAQLIPVVVFVVVIVGMFWWIVIRPANKRAKEHIELVRSLREGDKVVTAGGIHGKIVKVKEKTVDVEVGSGIILTFDKYAIRRRLEDA